MADDSDSRLPSASLTGQDRRRILLLNSTIELLSPAVYDKLKLSKRFSVERRFWGKLQTFILNVEEINWRFSMFIDQTGLVETLLLSLESMIHLKNGTAEEFEAFAFPRLETLRGAPQSAEAKGHSMVSPELLIIPEECESFKMQLDQLEEVLVNASDSPPPEEVTITSNTAWKKSMWPALKNLLTVVSSHWNCSCRPHQAALLLFTHRKGLKRQGPMTFTMLFRHEEPLIRWQESSITINEKIPRHSQSPPGSDYVLAEDVFPRPTLLKPETATSGHGAPKLIHKVDNLCAEIFPMEQARLDLDINGRELYRLPDSGLQMKELRSGEIVTLSKGILQSNSVGELSSKAKICLAVVLSWSLLDFCDEPWFRGGWTKDTIHMMQHDNNLFLRPLLVTEMCSPTTLRRSNIGRRMNEDLLFLHHGFLLMEIFRQEPFDANLNIRSGTNIAETRRMLLRLYRRVNWDVHERFQQSVKACIDASQSNISNSASESPTKFAQAFCENVIGPLHDQYEKDWGQKDPDKVIASIKLRILQQPSQVKKFAPSSQSKSRSLNTVTPLRASTARKSVQRKMKFYDSADEPELQQIKEAQAWFSMFDHEDIREMLPKRPKSKEDGLKIAVLDTGINMDLPNIRSKKGRINCWPKISACRDEDGHGTHVAYLLLRLAPHARLLVSKVSKSSLLIDADIQMIADAITHYSSGEDKADIINLSFGFPAQTAKHSLIRDALVKARQNNVLIFAAAGNSGGNETVSWPASMTSHVLRIDSSDGKGNPSAFSAGSGLGRKICTLGEGVPSCELKAGSKTDYIYRNGTSFATPIAAAIASIVLAFSDKFRSTPENAGNEGTTDAKSTPENKHALPNDVNELVRRLRTKSGMEEILCQMCVAEPNQPRQGYYYIAPWYFLQTREQERIHVILNHLRRVSE